MDSIIKNTKKYGIPKIKSFKRMITKITTKLSFITCFVFALHIQAQGKEL
jgi:hypothetical protein